MIYISGVKWISKNAKEAEVCLSDSKFKILAFSHPFTKQIGDAISDSLYAFNSDNIYLVKDNVCLIERNGGQFEYILQGIVNDKKNNRVKIGEFIIELDKSIPIDINEGETINFTCERIDLY